LDGSSGNGPSFLVHENPAWRSRANFILHARVQSNQANTQASSVEEVTGSIRATWSQPPVFEQLWTRRVRRLGSSRFEVCCIPFFVYDINLGDEVEVEADGDLKYVVKRVVKRSGHWTFRAWFGETSDPHASLAVVDDLTALGCEIEWSSDTLLAVDASSQQSAMVVADLLGHRQSLGQLIVESGWTQP
jgi:hypothetical protein